MNIINKIGKYKQPSREWFQRNVNTIRYITVHHTADTFSGTDEQVLQKEANTHINNGWPGLAYHFFITKNGNIYQINNYSDVTWHDAVNWDSIGVVLHGYFHPSINEKPAEKQLQSLRWLLDQLSTQHPEFPAAQGTVMGHRERSSTACPGDSLIGYTVDYRNKLGNVSWGSLPSPTPTPPPLTDKQLVAETKIILKLDTPESDRINKLKSLFKL